MNRPCDWSPLAEGDPLPGDPDAIRVEAVRLSELGGQMRAQAARLRHIGADATLVGAYAEELRSASADLAKDLDRVAERYERVGSALVGWAPKLTEAQDLTLAARSKAIEAEQFRQRSTPLFEEPGWGQNTAGAIADPVAASRLAGQQDAEAMLAHARRMLLGALEQAQAWGRHYADLIEEASDILKDGRWDNFKDWADRNADWIESYTDNLGWVATGLAIAAIFVPGANVLVWSAIGLTAVSAATHGTLLATGNGSWADLGLDVFALATFGAGAAAAKGLKSAQLAARAAAAGEVRQAAVQAALRASRNEASALAAVAGRAESSLAAREAAEAALRTIDERALQQGALAAERVLAQPVAAATHRQALIVGERGSARAINDLFTTAAHYPNAPGVAEAVMAGGRYYGAAQMGFLSGTAADAEGKADDIVDASKWLSYRLVGSSWKSPAQGAPS